MRRTMIALLVATAGFAGIAAASGEAAARPKLKALGLKIYWSMLDSGQKARAKEILAAHLAETAPDRLEFAARVLRYKADVARVLTKGQRARIGKVKAVLKRLPADRQKALLDKFLDRTDRALLAERIGSLDGATPESRVAVGIQILDQLHDALKAALVERVELTEEQARKIDLLWQEVKKDLEPVAVRLAKAREEVIRKGVALLNEEQKAKLTKVKETVTEKVLAFLRG